MSEPKQRKVSSNSNEDAIATRAIHAGWDPLADPTGSVMPPVYLTSTYVQKAPAEPRLGYEYTRTQNPTRFALQDAIANLEGGAGACTFASGMAAIHTLLLTLRSGDRIVASQDLYGGSHRLFRGFGDSFGLHFDFVDTTDPKVLENLPDDTRLLYVETPTNPTLRITDLELAVKAAARVGAELCVDNTFATPVLQRPLEWGADFVVHSTTKYIGGHSDVVGGALIARTMEQWEQAAFHQNSAGAVNGPFDAFLTLRGLRTLPLRMERHCSNAVTLVNFLEQHPKVERVLYPGLEHHPNHAIAARQMSAFGGMISFVLATGTDQASEFSRSCRLFQLAESLGGIESLIELPAPMTHASVSAEQRKLLGIEDGLVRLSVGLESVEDLRDDLAQALSKLD